MKSEIFSKSLISLRNRMGITQEQLGQRLRISKNYVYMLEKGRRPSEKVISLAREIETELNAGEHGPAVSNLDKQPYGELPKEYDMHWQAQWNSRIAEMPREQVCDLVDEACVRLRTDPPGPALAHRCHYIMDLLNELANRKPLENKDGTHPE